MCQKSQISCFDLNYVPSCEDIQNQANLIGS